MLEYQVLLTYPLVRHLSMGSWVAALKEDVLEVDGPTADPLAAGTWNGFSGNGSVLAPLVFVNYGRPEDYAALRAQGLDLSGRIHLVKYGKTFRGNKVVNAEAAGAVGVLIYSDPGDDGASQGPTYPDGPWRPMSGVQRGSVWVGNGDAMTPSWASVPGCPRLTGDEMLDPEVTNGWPLPTIPVQPISAADALPLLQSLASELGPAFNPSIINIGWSTPLVADAMLVGAELVNLTVYLDYQVKSIYNVIGVMKGTSEPDRHIILGCHRDAWTMGAGDPISGHTALLETATLLAGVREAGWEPRRSILIASWYCLESLSWPGRLGWGHLLHFMTQSTHRPRDAEESGLIGSTEFAEQFRTKLTNEAIVYLNSDIGVTGSDYLAVHGNPQLSQFVAEAAADSPLLTSDGRTLLEMLQGHEEGAGWHLDPVGSGSDYTPFLQMLGVPVLDIRFESQSDSYSGVYHSNYDSYRWYKEFGDPDFEYHSLLARFWTVLVMRLSQSKIVPFHYQAYAALLQDQADSYRAALGDLGVSVAPLDLAIIRFNQSAVLTDSEGIGHVENTNPLTVRDFNNRLAMVERQFLSPVPLPGRGWYRHLFFAPSLVDAYSAQLFPLLSDAVAAGSALLADREVRLLAMRLNAAADFLTGAGFAAAPSLD